jgi:alanine-glyoxylate transaminase/serine-glyoxylate transaminase/serine-pyruvate transaminase
VRSPVGGRPALEDVERALEGRSYKLMTVTHVDTSTGVITDVKSLAALARRHGVLSIVDGVCSVAGEELRMTEWGVDVALTASQKAISVPPGLALVVAGPRAIEAFRARGQPVANYYADWNNWLPIMEAYEARRPSYFGTPPVNLIWALNVSLGQILDEGMETRFARHRALSSACKAATAALGLRQVPTEPTFSANTMTAPYYPEGVAASELLPRIKAAGAVVAGGLHPEIRAEYFRVGHMGPTNLGDVLATVGAIEAGLAGCGYAFESGVGVAAAQAAYSVNGA